MTSSGGARVWAGRGLAVGGVLPAALVAALAGGAMGQVRSGVVDVGGLAGPGPFDHGLFECGEGCGKAHALQRLLRSGADGVADGLWDGAFRPTVARATLDETDVEHVFLDLEVIPSTSSLAGTCTMDVAATRDGVSDFTVRLRSNLTITSVTVDGVAAAWVRDSTTSVTVALGRTLTAGERFRLVVGYNGQPVSRGLGSIEFRTTPDGRPWVYTLSEPYFAYTWWPAKDGDFGVPGDNSDKFSLDFWLTNPAGLRSVSNGVLEGVDALSGGRQRFRWSHGGPISTYLVAFATGPYNTYTQSYTHAGGTMPIELNILPTSDTAALRNAWFRSAQMMAVFRPLFGEYPFVDEKYGIYEFGFSGGMEHQTNSGQLATTSESLTVHELLHQWFGDDITCRTWNDIWLNEGFASYSEALWEERKNGGLNGAALRSAMSSRRPSTLPSGSVYAFDTGSPNAIFSSNTTYRKSAWVLHMLRRVLGDEAFFAAVRAYRAEWSGGAPTTQDFRASIERATGVDLSQFFNQWVFGTGEPDYRFSVRSDTVEGQSYLRLRVRQVQSTTHGSGGVFVMPIDIGVTGQAGVTVMNTLRDQHFVVPVAGPASTVQFDPEQWILWAGAVSEPYQSGPPVVVSSTVSPGQSLGVTPPGSVELTFVEPVRLSVGDVTLTGPAGPIAASVSDVSGGGVRFAVALPERPLAGRYTLSVADTVTSVATGQRLDGDVLARGAGVSPTLPSGNGVAGGGFALAFDVGGGCAADLAVDGSANVFDVLAFFDAFGAQRASADVAEPIGTLDVFDVFAFFALFASCQ